MAMTIRSVAYASATERRATVYREDCGTPSPLRANCAKRLQQPKQRRLARAFMVWTNHVKVRVVASENALPPDEPIASHPHAIGLGNGPGVVCVVVGDLGGFCLSVRVVRGMGK